ncbi:hypothetical protein BFP72_12310 [Reichenbachiella sp. 5M10]|uniref:c-type cytochrome n=1 Tax=Reichenbachiella sp. 5M10 TaxID=1889772 RepID=UPI000C158E76|nr:cytochrome c [Reichenbachiella sp. 5M10]PIB36122.1 hypothetical protein BFP72_12310 [Reichenbachiella sp. 5M10]
MKNINKFVSLFIVLLALSLGSCKHSNPEEIKLRQYLIQGEQLYRLHCANCHQNDGSGLGLLIPPIDSAFIQSNLELSICAIKHGLTGPISINHKTYDGEMPANPRLTSLEIAEIITFIDVNWGKKKGITTISTVEKSLNLCK